MDWLYAGWAQFQALRAQWGIAFDLLLVLVAVVAINRVLRRLFRALSRRFDQTPSIWDDAIFYTLSRPVRAGVWVIGFSLVVHLIDPAADSVVGEALVWARIAAWVAIATWLPLRLITEVQKNIVRRAVRRGQAIDRTTVDAVTKLARLGVVLIAALTVLHLLGVSLTALLAFGGVGGIAFGFAAKDVIANLLGGVMIYLNRPFDVGEWISSPDRAIEGVVEDIGWRATTIRQFDMRPIYVPNAIFTTVVLENASRMTHRRIYERIGIRFDDVTVVAPIVAAIREMLGSHTEIDHNEFTVVYFNEFGQSSLDLFVYCHTITREWVPFQDVKQQILIQCQNIIAEHGAELAYPTSTVYAPAGLEGLRTRPGDPDSAARDTMAISRAGSAPEVPGSMRNDG